MIYEFSQTPVPDLEAVNKLAAQQEAFQFLVREVRRWSDHVDLLVNGNLIVRITVTFVSPEMVEGVILNQLLYSQIPVADFSTAVQKGQEDIAKRDEYLFLVTLTASEYKEKLLPNDPLLVEIPVSEMKLTNSAELSVESSHRDDLLNNSINLRSKSAHGYLGYPIAVEQNSVCHWVMDPAWNTTLSLHVPNVRINGADYGPLTWSIGYRSLIVIDGPDNIPAFIPPPPGEQTKYSPGKDAPPPMNGIPLADTSYWNVYWEEMSRYIWYHLSNTAQH